MIKIRYSHLPSGLHVRVEAHGRSTIIYLLPGLTLAQRRAALVRARMSASMGYGPGLPTTGLAAAVMLDRIRATLRNGAAAFRAHPLLLVPPLIILLSATFTYIMTAAVTITIHSPRAPGLFPPLNLVPGAHRTLPSAQAGEPGGSGGRGLTPGNSRGGKPSKSPGWSRSPSPSDSTTAPPRSSSPSPPASTPPGTVSPSPSPSPSPSWPCVEVGILGICLKL